MFTPTHTLRWTGKHSDTPAVAVEVLFTCPNYSQVRFENGSERALHRDFEGKLRFCTLEPLS